MILNYSRYNKVNPIKQQCWQKENQRKPKLVWRKQRNDFFKPCQIVSARSQQSLVSERSSSSSMMHHHLNLNIIIITTNIFYRVVNHYSYYFYQSSPSPSSLPLLPELENVKSFTRTKINKPDFTLRKARKSRHFWHFKPTKLNLWGFLWWINVDKLSI